MGVQTLISTDWQALFLPLPITFFFYLLSPITHMSTQLALDSCTLLCGEVDSVPSEGQRHLVNRRNEGLMSCLEQM